MSKLILILGFLLINCSRYDLRPKEVIEVSPIKTEILYYNTRPMPVMGSPIKPCGYNIVYELNRECMQHFHGQVKRLAPHKCVDSAKANSYRCASVICEPGSIRGVRCLITCLESASCSAYPCGQPRWWGGTNQESVEEYVCFDM